MRATREDLIIVPENATVGLTIIMSTKGASSGAQRYAAYYGIHLKTVPHGSDYSFRYEEVVLHGRGLALSARATATFSAEVIRP
jgi:hypothetical protein